MAKGKKSKKELSSAQKIEIGVGLTAAAVAAAGAYFLYGSKNADKNRKTVKSWALKAKADVLEKLEEAKEMTRGEYEELLQAAIGAYGSAKTATKKDVKEFTTEMMEHWSALEKNMMKKKRPAKKTAKKTAKKVAKKPAKKTAKKATKKTPKK